MACGRRSSSRTARCGSRRGRRRAFKAAPRPPTRWCERLWRPPRPARPPLPGPASAQTLTELTRSSVASEAWGAQRAKRVRSKPFTLRHVFTLRKRAQTFRCVCLGLAGRRNAGAGVSRAIGDERTGGIGVREAGAGRRRPGGRGGGAARVLREASPVRRHTCCDGPSPAPPSPDPPEFPSILFVAETVQTRMAQHSRVA